MTADLQKTANALVWCSIGALLSLLGFTLPGCVLILIGATAPAAPADLPFAPCASSPCS